MRSFPAVSLTVDAYAPYGDVIVASPRGEGGRVANQGRARVFDRLVDLVNERPRARANLSVFRCDPWPEPTVRVALLEKHPLSTQVFVPMNASRYLAIVALGGDRPDLSTLRAFVAGPAQGVSYRPGVWHHPMIALDRVTDFACLVWEDQTSADCVLVRLETSEQADVSVP